MPWLLLILSAAAGVVIMNGSSAGSSGIESSGGMSENGGSNPWNLPDVDSSNQGGSYDTQYDEAMENASGATGVPFALIKAHAIRESSLNPLAYHFDNSVSGASYGLMQCEWVYGRDRFAKYGWPDSKIGMAGDMLYDPGTSCFLGACIIRDNLNWLKKLRDAVNAYNTGTTEAKHEAPANYVNDVLGYYSELVGKTVG